MYEEAQPGTLQHCQEDGPCLEDDMDMGTEDSGSHHELGDHTRRGSVGHGEEHSHGQAGDLS